MIRRRRTALHAEYAHAVLKATKDPTSLGNILREGNLVSEEDLARAIDFQNDNPDVLLGDTLVRLGVLERSCLEALLLKQEAVRKQDAKSVGKLVKLATSRTRDVVEEIRSLHTHIGMVAKKP